MSSCISIPITAVQRRLLEAIIRAPSSEQRYVFRATLLLSCAYDACNQTVAHLCGTLRTTVRKWRRRWLAAQDILAAAETQQEGALPMAKAIVQVLQDAPRAGRPPTFTAEQLTQLVALACKPPAEAGVESTHWTPRDLAATLQRLGIVDSISPRHVGRFLKGGRPQAASKSLLAELRTPA